MWRCKDRRSIMSEKTFKLKNSFLIIAAGIAFVFLANSHGWTQQKRKLAFEFPTKTSKYTRQHVFDVKDVPGHQIRIYELHRTWPTNRPVIEGVRIMESWQWGNSDYFDRNGRHYGYGFFALENRDKIFFRYEGTSQTVVRSDGSKKGSYAGVLRYTGGIGKFRGIQGTFRYNGLFDPQANLNQGGMEGEYWIE
jgi:hypothetical protein